MSIRFDTVQVAVWELSLEGRLAFSQDRLVGVLTLLTEEHGEAAGRWFLEAGFGRIGEREHPIFADLDKAAEWLSDSAVERRAAAQGRAAIGPTG